MANTLIEIEQQAAQLPPSDRAKLAEFLLESLQDSALAEIQQEWEQEIASRVAAFEKSETTVFAAGVVFAAAKKCL